MKPLIPATLYLSLSNLTLIFSGKTLLQLDTHFVARARAATRFSSFRQAVSLSLLN